MRASATAMFRPLAPVGGTMWTASPARNAGRIASAGDDGAQLGHVALEDLALPDFAAVRVEHAGMQLVPESRIRPAFGLVDEVPAGTGARCSASAAAQRKAAVVLV